MSIFKCKMCGGTIEFEEGSTVGVCDSCGTKQTLPRLDSERKTNLFDRANHFRRNNEFDKASGLYEQILTEDTTDAEAYWSLVLCRYGIEYVEDPTTRKRVPTVNRAQFTSIYDDDNYKSAIRYADGYQRFLYEEEAASINEIQKGILAISQKEEPFDVFICYKETDNDGRRTQDSVLANDLYHQLTQEGFKVFFSRITLEDKLGTAYEPYIFAALNSAKVMVVLGTKPEHFNAVWVKNEWSRYLSLVKQSGGKKVLIPAYRDMDPYDLPEEFSHLQAQDMSKLGFMQDLIRGIKKIVMVDELKASSRETIVVNSGNANADTLLRRAFMFLEDGEWAKADDFCEQVLNLDPENAQAYLGKLLAELHVRRQENLPNCEQPFDRSSNYQKAIRFGGEKLSSTLEGYVSHINERNENTRLTGIYNGAVKAMNSAGTEAAYKAAASTFKTIPGFKDADSLSEQCLERAEICRKDAIYANARSQMTGLAVNGYEAAINTFRTIPGWKDADEQIYACQRKIEEIKAKDEADQLEAARKAEVLRVAAEKTAKRRKIIIAITMPIVVACIAFLIVRTTIIIPNSKYNSAMDLYNAGKYHEAKIAFLALNGYKDSTEQITKCETAIKDSQYNSAMDLYSAGKYDEAITAFQALNDYKDSKKLITKCETAIKDSQYNSAMDLYSAGKYDEAITAFQALNDYKDSKKLITKCETAIKDSQYNSAISLIEEGKYIEAYEALIDMNVYKDSAAKAKEIYGQYKAEKWKTAKVGDYVIFGSYEQDNRTYNGKEDVEWLVLAKEGDKALVISRYGLDCQQYNTSYTSVKWETCSLRTWLNGTFINNAFSSDEKAMIQSTTVTADKNPSYNTSPGNDTTDKVFLLSITEVNKYFGTDSARQCKGTDYCYAQGAKRASNDNCWWWLRSPGDRSDDAAYVYNGGSVSDGGSYVGSRDVAVRPALWIYLGS